MKVHQWCICIIVVFYGNCSYGVVRTWTKNVNILNKSNQEKGLKNCKGLIFPETSNTMYTDSLKIREIVMPMNGELLLSDGAVLTFDPSDEKCIRIKEQEPPVWWDPRNWNDLRNKAIPDTKRIPCESDDVIIPKDSPSDIEIGTHVTVKSFRTLEQIREPVFLNDYPCKTEEWDCYCNGPLTSVEERTCEVVRSYRDDTTLCSQPIDPPQHCTSICGAYFLFPASYRSKHKKIHAFLKENADDVDFYIGKLDLTDLYTWKNSKYELIIVDKDNTSGGYYSTHLAKMLDEQLKKSDGDLYINSYEVFISGSPLNTEERKTTYVIVFGALVAVVLFFAVVHFVYNDDSDSVRFPIVKRFRPFVFAKFENIGEGGLRFSRESLGSVVSLEKSFDNPMYGKEVPSTSDSYVLAEGSKEDDLVVEATELLSYEPTKLVELDDVEDLYAVSE